MANFPNKSSIDDIFDIDKDKATGNPRKERLEEEKKRDKLKQKYSLFDRRSGFIRRFFSSQLLVKQSSSLLIFSQLP